MCDQEAMMGRWAVCSQGRIGCIEGRELLAWGLSWVGIGLDGKPWSSRVPRLLANDDAALIASIARQTQSSF
jgi:hypothetical protein